MTLKNFLILGVILTTSFGFAACTPSFNQQIEETTEMEDDLSQENQENQEMTEVAPTLNVVELAQGSGSFSKLLSAVEAAGLTEALAVSEVTVFAPTDEAFEALPAGMLEDLLNDQQRLSEVLQYHVIPGSVTSLDIVSMPSITTLQGETLEVTTDGSGIMIDQATVLQPDVMASNGVIHVIDSVLLPESK
jgi:uncharacterized surface protein with fasciclin (FAS1) repeats